MATSLTSTGVTFPDSTTQVTASSTKAWVNFNGTGTVSIRASRNISSITDNGTGDYRLNFTSSLPDANYAVSGLVRRGGVNNDCAMVIDYTGTNFATTSCRIVVVPPSAYYLKIDADIVCVTISR